MYEGNYEGDRIAKADADIRKIVENRKCLTFVIEQYFHPKVICADPGGTCARLDDTIALLSRNLKREEMMMEEAEYPDLTTHEKEHEKVLGNLDTLRRTLVCGGYNNHLVFKFLMDWADNHSRSFDKYFEDFLRGRDKGIDRRNVQ